MRRCDDSAGRQVAALQFVVGGIVGGRFFDGQAVGRVLGQAETEAVALDAVVRRTVFTERFVLHAKDDPAFGISRSAVGIDRPVMLLVGGVRADAVVRLDILCIALPADRKAQACEAQQIALVGRIDEDPGPHLGAVVKMQRREAASLLRHPGFFREPMPAQHGDARFLHPGLPDGLRDVRLKPPELRVLAAGRQHGVERGRATVLGADATVKLQCQATHGRAVPKRLVVDVRTAQALHTHAAEMLPGLHQNHPATHLRHLNRGDHPRAGAAVDADIGFQRRRGGGNRETGEENQGERLRHGIH